MAEGLAGWDMDRWRQVLRDAAPRLAYVVADFHNPTGALADEDQRRGWSTRPAPPGTVLVADETMTELQLDDGRSTCPARSAPSTRPAAPSSPSARPARRSGPGMRIGWVRAAPDVIRSLVAARAYADLGTPVLEQLAVELAAAAPAAGSRPSSIRRDQARENRDALVAAVRRELPDWEFERARAAASRSGCGPAGCPAPGSPRSGERVGVRVPSGPRFGVDGAFEGYRAAAVHRRRARSPTRRRRGWPRRRGWWRRARRRGGGAAHVRRLTPAVGGRRGGSAR